MNTTEDLWAEMAPTYAEILEHPFIAGLRDGSLREDRFQYYVFQDSLYLREYCRALCAVAARAPHPEWTALFASHAAEAIRVETELHAGLLERLGATEAEAVAVPASPTTTAYTSYLLAATHGRSFAEGLGAVLPCYWIYREVGRDLVRSGSPNPVYAEWIATYGDAQFDAVVQAVLAVVTRLGEETDGAAIEAMRPHVGLCARYEYMFWDAAWRLERWPLIAAEQEVVTHG